MKVRTEFLFIGSKPDHKLEELIIIPETLLEQSLIEKLHQILLVKSSFQILDKLEELE